MSNACRNCNMGTVHRILRAAEKFLAKVWVCCHKIMSDWRSIVSVYFINRKAITVWNLRILKLELMQCHLTDTLSSTLISTVSSLSEEFFYIAKVS